MAFDKICPNCDDGFSSRDQRQVCCSISCASTLKLKTRRLRGPTRRPIEWRVTGTGCWECTSHTVSKRGRGYPQITPLRCSVNLHRYIYEVLFGEIAPGIVIRHTCDNKLCINPEHLLPGTVADNARDARQRDRYTKGEQVHAAKLVEGDVRYVLEHPEVSIKLLADKFGVHKTTIYFIRKGKRWKHVAAS